MVGAERQCSPLDSQTCLKNCSVLSWALGHEAVRSGFDEKLPIHLSQTSLTGKFVAPPSPFRSYQKHFSQYPFSAPPRLCVYFSVVKLGVWVHPDLCVGILFPPQVCVAWEPADLSHLGYWEILGWWSERPAADHLHVLLL